MGSSSTGKDGAASALQLGMAAALGAAVMAASAFYLHKRSVDRLLQQALDGTLGGQEGEGEGEEEEEEHFTARQRHRQHSNGNNRGSNNNKRSSRKVECRSSISMPDVTAAGWSNGGFDKTASFGSLASIPPGLPRLQTRREGSSQSLNHPGSRKRAVAPVIRPTTPKSPVASTFESVEDSDEEDDLLVNQEDQNFNYDNDNGDIADEDLTGTVETSANHTTSTLVTPDLVNADVDQNHKSGTIMMRSHSISGDFAMHAPDPVAADILRREPEQDTLVRLKVTPIDTATSEEEEVCRMMQECLVLREKYVFRDNVAPWENEIITDPCTPKRNPNPFYYEHESASEHHFVMEDGVVHVYANKDAKEELFPVADATTFFTDLHRILRIIALGNVRTMCHHRLRLLEQKFSLHLMLNADREFMAQKSAPHRDFYNVRKVDTHVHHSACMNQKHLLRFIKSKLKKEPDEVVIFRDGKYLTLKEVFESLDLTGYDLNVDLLDVHADKNTFHRFDKFNLKYNPCGQSRLREIFLKQDNLIQGRFLAELTKQVLSDLVASKYQMAEYRISVYGRKQSEWDQLASWFVNNEIYSENAIWLIQLPRLYNVYKGMGIVTSFQNMLDNIFIPLFEVTINPSSHPQLHVFLKQVVGFDMVDDESKPERRPTKHMPTPSQWTNAFNPAFSYYAYYCYANLYTLNKLRESKGMTTIRFRPHCGEAGDIDHLAATFLVTHNIAHGNNLRKSPGLQYLYYLAQIGLAMSPLSNNSLFLDYHRNPFPMFFSRGLNVSLSTDDPLQIHLTKEPLVEEYSVAAQVWKLSPCDLCEIARNSVYQSGFSHACKSHWVGSTYFLRGPEGNDIHRTNVPHLRVEFRHEVWKEEMQFVYLGQAKTPREIYL